MYGEVRYNQSLFEVILISLILGVDELLKRVAKN